MEENYPIYSHYREYVCKILGKVEDSWRSNSSANVLLFNNRLIIGKNEKTFQDEATSRYKLDGPNLIRPQAR